MLQVTTRALAVVAAVAQLGSAMPSGTATQEPCLQVSKLWTTGKATDKNASVSVPASLAYACLKSVPLHKEEAIQLVDSIRPYLEWQSDTAYKANPPSDYAFAGYDLFHNLAAIRSKLTGDKYSSEYDFHKDLYETVFSAGHDGHLYLLPDLLTRATRFRRKLALISISDSGSVPDIKVFSDVQAGGNASAVTQINGRPAVDFLSDYVRLYSGSQDFDAGYNSMFYQQSHFVSAKTMGDFATGGGGSLIYHGANTTLTFQNGTTVSTENFAQLRGDWEGVVDGTSFYNKFCAPVKPAKSDKNVTSPDVNGALPGYPKPIVMSTDGQVSGYYLEGEGHETTAVLALLSFEPNSLDEFQAKIADFLSRAQAAGKTKLVIDFQANGGGYVLLGYDLFRQLFPSIVQNGYSRWKESKSFVNIARTYSEEIAAALASNGTASEATVQDYRTSFPYQVDLNITNDPFETFEDKFAPSLYMNTNYSQIMRMDLEGSGIYGYGDLANRPQPFAAENIVLLYDGYCASTCTLASEMLRIQGGVKSVTFGGRPVAGPMQGVGGVKGAQVLTFTEINRYVKRAMNLTNDANRRTEFARFGDLAMKRTVAAAVNVRDQILQDNVEDGLPAQYVYEPADCRMYWSKSMATDVSQIWKSAANAAFNNAQCANGGITVASSQDVNARSASQAAQKLHSNAIAGLRQGASFKPAPTDPDWLAQYLQKVTRVV
ncbi:hypothetical protein NLG97_g835 [Lecanicillium saksenae]|uniref:Uncharacterized protein n=1 Tax=Lecanicillium saksenae TaxID=468837 RepID=A0ACC1R5G4_9HYPO|nr:hypothetical protein NLG97_g835 [Lecanicillium saksenae]